MKPLILFPHEVRRLIDTGSVTVWRPIDRIGMHGKVAQFGPSDTPGYEWHFRCKRGLWQDYRDAELIKVAPHPPGSERWVKERFGWAVTPKGKSVIVYQADNQARPVLCDNEGEGDCVGIGKKPVEYVAVDGVLWKAAQRMPRWASRLSVTSAAVQARQVQRTTEEEAVEAGLTDLTAFSEWWQTRFDTLGPNTWAWATTLTRKNEG